MDIGDVDVSSAAPSGSHSPGSPLSTLTPTPPPSPPKIMLKIRIPPRPPNSQHQQQPPPLSDDVESRPGVQKNGPASRSQSSTAGSPVASTSHTSPGKIILPIAPSMRPTSLRWKGRPLQRRIGRHSVPGSFEPLQNEAGLDAGRS